jgi:hypothetical protein
MLQIAVECLFDTGCLFSNFIKEDAARQLGSSILEGGEGHRQVTLADGSLTSSLGSLSCNVMLRHKSHGTFGLHNICFHILRNLAFDVIIGYPCIVAHCIRTLELWYNKLYLLSGLLQPRSNRSSQKSTVIDLSPRIQLQLASKLPRMYE